MREDVRRQLEQLAEPEYQRFTCKLLPNVENVMGVRLPALRALAKKLAKGDWQSTLAEEDRSFEERMLRGMIVGCAAMEPQARLRAIAAFVPLIDNWSICDSFCASLKDFTRGNRHLVWPFVLPYLQSAREYEVRFGAVMLLDYFLLDETIDRVLELLGDVRHRGYYAQMAVAWALSICYVEYPQKTYAYLCTCTLDAFTYRKALQKTLESRRLAPEERQRVEALRRKIKE